MAAEHSFVGCAFDKVDEGLFFPLHELRMAHKFIIPGSIRLRNDDPNQTRAGIGTALKPWAYKVLRVTRPITADEVIETLALAA